MLNLENYREYTDYHTRIVQKMIQVLDARDVQYEIRIEHETCASLEQDLDNNAIKDDSEKLLIIFTLDILNGKGLSLPDRLGNRVAKILKQLEHLNRPVLWLTAIHNVASDFDPVPNNVHFLNYGGDILIQMKEYPQILPQRDKNPSMSKFWISMSRSPRLSRMMTAFCLMGNNLGHGFEPETGIIRISNYPIENYQHWQDYYRDCISEVAEVSDHQNNILQQGFLKIKNLDHGGQPDSDIFAGLKGCDCATNFDRSLRHLYKNTLVELVNETTFFSKGIFITEKFLNSVYGYNFPIVFSTPGTVEHLRQAGFDMFDDVVNHEYDTITDPIQRIFTAIESNIQLLTNKSHTHSAWNHCLKRMDNNYKYAQHEMYEYFYNQFCRNLIGYLELKK